MRPRVAKVIGASDEDDEDIPQAKLTGAAAKSSSVKSSDDDFPMGISESQTHEKPKALMPVKPKTKPKLRLAVVRPEGATTRCG
ncbi:hypothetical protein GW17_00037398 [Ensete ventricosum]|uniref:Uncharacterized protein n=1 Tax=Ensete ventricosum TaxID=4639 RepID=A0A444DNF9_ENSVE|nr:hypothetical protein GW17_00037398 [Ensete ventricosum]RZR70875.1 hypothetical protein BHM03_00002008 [Ensete ventricosum]